jgi:hypothetical protein
MKAFHVLFGRGPREVVEEHAVQEDVLWRDS